MFSDIFVPDNLWREHEKACMKAREAFVNAARQLAPARDKMKAVGAYPRVNTSSEQLADAPARLEKQAKIGYGRSKHV